MEGYHQYCQGISSVLWKIISTVDGTHQNSGFGRRSVLKIENSITIIVDVGDAQYYGGITFSTMGEIRCTLGLTSTVNVVPSNVLMVPPQY